MAFEDNARQNLIVPDSAYMIARMQAMQGDKPTGTNVMINGQPQLQQQYGKDEYGNPLYTYSAAPVAPVAPPQSQLTDPGLIAKLAQGGSGPVSTNHYGGMLAAPQAGPPPNNVLAQYLAQMQARQASGNPGVGAPIAAPPPGIGGGSSMPVNSPAGFQSMLQGLKAGGTQGSLTPINLPPSFATMLNGLAAGQPGQAAAPAAK
jgi:hypothetical protein